MSAPSPFNSALELGVRCLVVLGEAFPNALSLERLVMYDYIVLHSADVGGPESIHPAMPMRTGEITVRRETILKGMSLMGSRGLIKTVVSDEGFLYSATDAVGGFFGAISAPYLDRLARRANWVVHNFAGMSDGQLSEVMRRVLSIETWQFQSHDHLWGRETWQEV